MSCMEKSPLCILMVCLGNICRSPIAEGLLVSKLRKREIDHVLVDSCGFERYHLNESPDFRSVEVCNNHGVDISKQRQRLFKVSDFDKFDKIYVMDANNYSDVVSYARNINDVNKVDFITNVLTPGKNIPVPDPYYGGKDGFQKVFMMLSDCTEEIVNRIMDGKSL
jgi:protein-tyrosine phosphatase